jgi:hypothetical protein
MMDNFVGIYIPMVKGQLEKLLVSDSFSHRFKNQIGLELDLRLGEPIVCDEQTQPYFRVAKLNVYLMGGWEFDLDWLAGDDGKLIDDFGRPYPDQLSSPITQVDLLAAYGLWQLNDRYWSIGFMPDDVRSRNEGGYTCAELVQNYSECAMRGYQALVFAQAIMIGTSPSKDELERAVLSANGRKAADALHDRPDGSRAKQQAVRALWASGKYSSKDICAEQECGALDMSFATARRALRRQPTPT